MPLAFYSHTHICLSRCLSLQKNQLILQHPWYISIAIKRNKKSKIKNKSHLTFSQIEERCLGSRPISRLRTSSLTSALCGIGRRATRSGNPSSNIPWRCSGIAAKTFCCINRGWEFKRLCSACEVRRVIYVGLESTSAIILLSPLLVWRVGRGIGCCRSSWVRSPKRSSPQSASPSSVEPCLSLDEMCFSLPSPSGSSLSHFRFPYSSAWGESTLTPTKRLSCAYLRRSPLCSPMWAPPRASRALCRVEISLPRWASVSKLQSRSQVGTPLVGEKAVFLRTLREKLRICPSSARNGCLACSCAK